MLKLSIEYCAPCGYLSRATGLTADLLKDFEAQIETLTLIPSDRGRFEVVADGELIYSKAATKRHAEPGEVANLVRSKIGAE